MSTLIHLSLSQPSQDEVLLNAQFKARRLQASATLPRGLFELAEQVRDGASTKGALRALGAMLGDVLFAGELSALLRGALGAVQASLQQGTEGSSAPALVLLLELTEELAALPWELTADPETSAPLLGEGRELVRVAGAPYETSVSRNEALVIASSAEAYRLSALKAAATQLRRRYHTHIEAIQSEEELELELNKGAPLFAHLYALDRAARLHVGASAAPFYELEGLKGAHLINCAPLLSSEHAHRARSGGAALIINRQTSLSVKASAESDRVLYHAFGSQQSGVQALYEARQALRDSEPEGYAWASLCLTAPPPSEPGEWATSPAFEPLPIIKEQLKESERVRGASSQLESGALSSQSELQHLPRVAPFTPLTPPVRASDFVQRTVQLVQSTQKGGSREEKLDLALRTGVMKQLSALAKQRGVSAELKQGLTRSEVLTYQLIEASRFNDATLKPVAQWYGHAEALAREVGVRVEGVAQAAQALLVSKAIWLCGADALTRQRVARGLCESLYQSYPLEIDGEAPLCPSALKDQGEATLNGAINGALWESAHLSWAPGASRPFEPNKLRPSERASVAAYHEEASVWRLYERVWVVVDQAGSCAASERHRATRALHEGVIQGLTDTGRSARCYLPLDQRVLYLSERPPQEARGEVVIELSYQGSDAALRWRQVTRARLLSCGVSPDEVERRVHDPLSSSLSGLLALCLDLNLCSAPMASDCFTYALLAGAQAAHVEEALELYLSPTSRQAKAEGHEATAWRCARAYAHRDQSALSSAWGELKGSTSAPDLPFVELPFG